MKSATRSKKGRVRWDEANLSENERVKKEINATAIEEPKTPYHSPCASQTDLRDLEVELDEYQAQLDEELTTAGLTDDAAEHEETMQNGTKRVSFDETAEGHDAEGKHASDFEEHRKEHYSMKDALKRGKNLVSQEENGQGNSEASL